MKPQLKTIDMFDGIAPELSLVEEEMHRILETENEMTSEASTHLLRAGGKRIRPALLLLASKFGRYEPDRLVPLAAAVEMIHVATLVHDDVVDRAATRRGIPTVNARWNEKVSVLVGDYLFAKSFAVLASCGDNRVVRQMADVVFLMCTGEMDQISRCYAPDVTEHEYFDRIGRKTARFIADSCYIGALVSGVPDEAALALRGYGFCIGLAFQITDDVLDLAGAPAQLGKPVGSDVRGGVVTLPVIHALSSSPRSDRLRMLVSRRGLGEKEISEIVQILKEAGSFRYAGGLARVHIERALEQLSILPDTPTRRTLELIAEFIASRDR